MNFILIYYPEISRQVNSILKLQRSFAVGAAGRQV